MLSIKNLTKRFGRTVVLSDISTDLPDGRFALVYGAPACGKTTLIDCVSGLLPFDGAVTLDGFSCRSQAAKQLYGRVGENDALYENLTVGEHMGFIGRAYKLDAEGMNYAAQLMTAFGLDAYRDRLASELSRTVRRRLSVVCALAHRPKILLLDRPDVGLDTAALTELKAVLAAFKLKGTSILCTAEAPEMFDGLWDAAYCLDGGRLTQTPVPKAKPEVITDAPAPAPTQTEEPISEPEPVSAPAPIPEAAPEQIPQPVPVSEDEAEAAEAPASADEPAEEKTADAPTEEVQ